jgi:GT2 family glycosyltransferase
MMLSSGRYIWVLNADTEITDYALDKMVQFMDEHPDVGALNPKVVYPDGTLQHSVMYLPTFLKALWEEIFWHTRLHLWFKREYRGKAYVRGVNYDDVLEMEWLRGSCLLIRREVYERVGGFDENFFFGHEEHDYSIRIRRAGWKLVWMPKAEIIHKASSAAAKFGPRLTIWKNYSKIFFWRKYKGRAAELCLRAMISIVQCVKLIGLFMLLFQGKDWVLKRIRCEAEILYWLLCGRLDLPDAFDARVWWFIKQNEDKGSHGFLQAIIPSGFSILDLGCNDGALVDVLLRKRINYYLGIDFNRNAITNASKRYGGKKIWFVIADIEQLPLKKELAGRWFDGVVLADVLEHIESSVTLLRDLSQMFVLGGRLRRAFVSIPNIAYWRIRLQLLRGRFEYQDCGILDRTHRWFFTLKTTKKLLEDGGWTILRVFPVPGYKGKGLRGKMSLLLAKRLPALFSPQFIFECVPNQVHIRWATETKKRADIEPCYPPSSSHSSPNT